MISRRVLAVTAMNIVSTSKGSDERQESPPGKYRRRNFGGSLLKERGILPAYAALDGGVPDRGIMSRVGKKPITIPSA
jgi:hypothetical protein